MKFEVNRKIKKLLKILFISIIIFYIGKYFFSNLHELKNFKFSLNPSLFLLSIVFMWIWMFINSLIYNAFIKKIDNKTKFIDNFKIWCFSYFGRYLPGKVGVIASRVFLHKEKGIKAPKVIFVFYIETVLSITSALIFFIILAFIYDFHYLNNYINISFLLTIIILISLHPKILNNVIYFLLKKVKKKSENLTLDLITNFNYKFYFSIVVINLIKWFFAGLGVFIVANAISDFPLQYYPYIAGNYTFAGVIGYLSFFAPSGIGVQEGILIYSFKFIMPGSIAVLVSILIRAWKTIGELTLVALLFIIFKLKKVY